jgi:hypothetical protein
MYILLAWQGGKAFNCDFPSSHGYHGLQNVERDLTSRLSQPFRFVKPTFPPQIHQPSKRSLCRTSAFEISQSFLGSGHVAYEIRRR